jgi:hypothetical protein
LLSGACSASSADGRCEARLSVVTCESSERAGLGLSWGLEEEVESRARPQLGS